MTVEAVVTKRCTGCLKSLVGAAFYRYKKGTSSQCRDCILRSQYVKRSGMPPETYVPLRQRPGQSREAYLAYMREYNRRYRVENKGRLAADKRRYASEAKDEGIAAYGSACQCCGEANKKFLTIDHINGRSDEPYRVTGKRLWQDLKRKGWPKDNYQLLCFNCNCAKGAYGRCPHQEENQ